MRPDDTADDDCDAASMPTPQQRYPATRLPLRQLLLPDGDDDD